jgi:hypothetical protein
LVAAVLLFSAELLVVASEARAETWNIVDYTPYIQSTNGTIESIRGTIVTSGPGPSWGVADMTASLSITTVYGIYTEQSAALPILYGPVVQEGTDLVLTQPGSSLQIGDYGNPGITYFFGPGDDGITVEVLDSGMTHDYDSGWTWLEWAGPPPIGLTEPDGSWILATATSVPEPTSLTLLISALLGLGLHYLRRRRAKA